MLSPDERTYSSKSSSCSTGMVSSNTLRFKETTRVKTGVCACKWDLVRPIIEQNPVCVCVCVCVCVW